jgi:hypothetical protein
VMSDSNFDGKLQALDLALFSRIPSQSTDEDRRSLLAIQVCAREYIDGYTYLEIGSHLGGSIQPHLQDPRCKKIYSIDNRPPICRDERGPGVDYPGNSTQQMLSLLAAIDSEKVAKVECIDSDTRTISPLRIQHAPNLCFIDGEHTPASVMADFDFCRRVCSRDATIVFHDAQIIFRGLRSVVSRLRKAKSQFSSHAMNDTVYVIGLDASPIPSRLDSFTVQTRSDDLWSSRNDLRLLKWRINYLRVRALNGAKTLLRAQ